MVKQLELTYDIAEKNIFSIIQISKVRGEHARAAGAEERQGVELLRLLPAAGTVSH